MQALPEHGLRRHGGEPEEREEAGGRPDVGPDSGAEDGRLVPSDLSRKIRISSSSILRVFIFGIDLMGIKEK